jgi:hypothetical protein
MSAEITPELSPGHTIERPIAPFARAYMHQIQVEPEHVRAYIGTQLMRGNSNPFLYTGENTAIVGLEPYLVGIAANSKEAVEAIGRYGDMTIKSLEALDDPYVTSRVRRITTTGRISTDVEERQKDLRVLIQADIAIGNTVRRLQAGMTEQGEAFRTNTYNIIGNPDDRFTYSLASHSESLVLPQTHVWSIAQRQPIDEVLKSLAVNIQRGYRFFSDLLKPVLTAPVERAVLQSLRTARA